MSNSRNKGRRGVLAVGGAMVVALALASGAAACTTYKGWFKVCDSSDNDGSQQGVICVQADASGSGMNNKLTSSGTGAVQGVGPSITAGTESFSASVGSLGGGNQLPQRNAANGKTYRIMFWDGAAYDNPVQDYDKMKDHTRRDCMSDLINELSLPLFGAVLKQIGTMDVDANGAGSGSYTIPSDARKSAAVGGQAGICVVDPNANYGNQVPVVVV